MKILNALQMHQLDAYTIEHEPITSAELMERASLCVAQEIESRWPVDTPVVVFAGSGNNGGDALCVARMLIEKEYSVSVYLFNTSSVLSPDCQLNKERLQTLVESRENCSFQEIQQQFTPPELSEQTVVVDGLFGTGLSRPLSGGYAAVVQYINASPATVVAIDVPSGLMTEENEPAQSSNVIHADYTFTFQHPKLSFLFPENERCVGEWVLLDIGLADAEQTDSPYELTTQSDFRDVLPALKPSRFAHKGTKGHACLVAGQVGMAGAAVLASRACMRSGVGKLTVRTEEANRAIMQVSVPEALLSIEPDDALRFTTSFPLDGYTAVGVGPGIGVHTETASALADLLYSVDVPLLLDADALNILSEHPTLISQIPANSILTPHRGELERLVGHQATSYDFLQATLRFASEHQVIVVMKGAYTAVVSSDGKAYFNPTGNPGMATAGSGDVLTGIILAMLAQGIDPLSAARLGVYVHGLAGDLCADSFGQLSVIASDLIDHLPQVYMTLNNDK